MSGARNIGMSQDKTEYVETACADGLPGFVIAFDGESTWLEGASLVALYGIIATAFWWG